MPFKNEESDVNDASSVSTIKTEADHNAEPEFATVRRRSMRVATKPPVRYVPPSLSDFDDTDTDGVNEESETQSESEHDFDQEEEEEGEEEEDEANISDSNSVSSNSTTSDEPARVITLRWDCPIDGCIEQTNDKIRLENHLMNCHKLKRFRCLVAGCAASFDDLKSSNFHHKKGHKRFACSKCKLSYPNYPKLYDHFYKFHEGSLFGCSKCDFSTDRNRCVMKQHLYKHKPAVHKCTIDGCNAAFHLKNELKRHLAYHTQNSLYFRCSICKEGYGTKAELNVHKCPDIIYRCIWPDCGHTNQYKSGMMSHIRFQHFHLPSSVKLQRKKGIVDDRDWKEWTIRVGSDGVTPISKPTRFILDGTLEEVNFSPPATPEHVPDLFDDADSQEENDETMATNSKQKQSSARQLKKKTSQSKHETKRKLYKILSIECYVCQATMNCETALDEHLLEAHQIKACRCQYKGCGASFTASLVLGHHLKEKHANVKKWQCSYCPKTYATHARLSMHHTSIHRKGQFQCAHPNCTTITPTRCTMTAHINHHKPSSTMTSSCKAQNRSNDRPYKCEQCDKTFPSPAWLGRHRSLHNATQLTCKWPECTYKTSYQYLLTRHVRKWHLNPPWNGSKQNEAILPVGQLEHDDLSQSEETQNISDVNDRMQSDSLDEAELNDESNNENESNMDCIDASRQSMSILPVATNQAQLTTRIIDSSSDSDDESEFSDNDTEIDSNISGDDDENDSDEQEPVSETDEEGGNSESGAIKKKRRNFVEDDQIIVLSLQCHLCGSFHSNKRKLYDHQRKRHRLYAYRCFVKGCTASFSDPFSYCCHRKQEHANVSSWLCQECPAKFTTYVQLTGHVSGKHIKGTFQCDFDGSCGLTFDTKDAAKRHKKTHYNKQFICPVKGCRKISSAKRYHENHIRTHTRERPYKCNECDKTFSTSSSRSDHRLIHRLKHTNGNRYRCTWPDCTVAQKIPSVLVRHIQRVHFRLHVTKRRNVEQIRDQDPAQYIAKIA